MTIKSSGTQLAFTEIEAEFGDNPERSLGQYRREDPSRVSSSNPNGLLNNSSIELISVTSTNTGVAKSLPYNLFNFFEIFSAL